MRQSCERLVGRRAALKLQAQSFNAQGTVDFAVVRQVLNSNASSQLTALQKGSLRAVACGEVWHKDRLIAAGYGVDPLCELCRADPDTMFHRIWFARTRTRRARAKQWPLRGSSTRP